MNISGTGLIGQRLQRKIVCERMYRCLLYTSWWVGSEDCPRGTSAENSNNPWRLVRTATAAEMSQYGNPTTCEIDSGGVIVADGFQASKAYSADSIVDYNLSLIHI